MSKTLKRGLLLTAAMVGLMGTAQAEKPANAGSSAKPFASFVAEVCVPELPNPCSTHVLSTHIASTLTTVAHIPGTTKDEMVAMRFKPRVSADGGDARLEYRVLHTAGASEKEVADRLGDDKFSVALEPNWIGASSGEFRGGNGVTQVLSTRGVTVSLSRAGD